MCNISPQLIRHMKSSPNMSKPNTIPPMDFMSSALGSDLGATLLSDEDEEEEDERYAVVSKNLCGFDCHGAENLNGPGTACFDFISTLGVQDNCGIVFFSLLFTACINYA